MGNKFKVGDRVGTIFKNDNRVGTIIGYGNHDYRLVKFDDDSKPHWCNEASLRKAEPRDACRQAFPQLKNGMVVKTRDGCYYVFVKDFVCSSGWIKGANEKASEEGVLIDDTGFLKYSDYLEGLFIGDEGEREPKYDIMKVWIPRSPFIFRKRDLESHEGEYELIFERYEEPEKPKKEVISLKEVLDVLNAFCQGSNITYKDGVFYTEKK